MLRINGVWFVPGLTNKMVLELETGELIKLDMMPYRYITEEEANSKDSAYEGDHPRKCRGIPVPQYMHVYYGLELKEEGATEVIHIRLTPSEKAKLEAYASNYEPRMTISEVVRRYIQQL